MMELDKPRADGRLNGALFNTAVVLWDLRWLFLATVIDISTCHQIHTGSGALGQCNRKSACVHSRAINPEICMGRHRI